MRRCAVDEMGRNSVTPCTTPRTSASNVVMAEPLLKSRGGSGPHRRADARPRRDRRPARRPAGDRRRGSARAAPRTRSNAVDRRPPARAVRSRRTAARTRSARRRAAARDRWAVRAPARSDVARSASSAGNAVALTLMPMPTTTCSTRVARAHHLGQHAGQLAPAAGAVDQLHVVRPLEARRHAQRRERARDRGAGQQRQRRDLGGGRARAAAAATGTGSRPRGECQLRPRRPRPARLRVRGDHQAGGRARARALRREIAGRRADGVPLERAPEPARGQRGATRSAVGGSDGSAVVIGVGGGSLHRPRGHGGRRSIRTVAARPSRFSRARRRSAGSRRRSRPRAPSA